MQIQDLKTPAFLVDHTVVSANCQAMARKAWDLGVRLRPHVKTHKTIEVARLQVESHFGGIAVSTLEEARFFAAGGFDDITYAVPMLPEKLDEATKIARKVTRLNLLLDHPDVAEAIAHHGLREGRSWSVFLKVDCGYNRAGVNPKSNNALELARFLYEEPAIDFRGILTHAGHSYDCHNAEEAERIAEIEVQVMQTFAQTLRESGIKFSEISIGSTPTCVHLKNADGITEIRPGNYALFDQFQADIGSCAPNQIAGSVLASVIGHYPGRNLILLNAGALALGKDPGATHVDPHCGFGRIVGFPHLRITGLSQEHGKIKGVTESDFQALPVGAKVRVIPNHVCLTAALYKHYNVVSGKRVMGQWRPTRGW